MPVSPPEPKFALDAVERQSALWQKLEAHLQKRLVSHRIKNDAQNQTDIQTAALRGAIAETKHLIGLGQPSLDDTAG